MKLWERMSFILDAVEALDYATQHVDDDDLEWPAFGEWTDAIGKVYQAAVALTSHLEIAAAIKTERDDEDHLADMADGASY
jgi:hypothetical protein